MEEVSTKRRLLAYFDVDCFYAQCEERKEPSFRGKPLAVTQKYIVVTCNYAAREVGITKLMAISEAKKRAKRNNAELILVSGEDLTPYRDASDEILLKLHEYVEDCPVERGGLDEFVIDITTLAEQEVTKASSAQTIIDWAETCVVHQASYGTVAEAKLVSGNSVSRPQDVRALTTEGGLRIAPDGNNMWLAVGTRIAYKIQMLLRESTELTCSVGIAHNRLLAKLVSGLHKPNGLTALPQSEAMAFLDPLPIRALDGVGRTVDKCLSAACRSSSTPEPVDSLTCRELREILVDHVSLSSGKSCRTENMKTDSYFAHILEGILSNIPQSKNISLRLVQAVFRAQCDRPVVSSSGMPKSVSREDSFAAKCRFQDLSGIVRLLSRDLAIALARDINMWGARRATKLVVTWRETKSKDNSTSRLTGKRQRHTVKMPFGAYALKTGEKECVRDIDKCSSIIYTVVDECLKRQLKEPFSVNLINLAATCFEKSLSNCSPVKWELDKSCCQSDKTSKAEKRYSRERVSSDQVQSPIGQAQEHRNPQPVWTCPRCTLHNHSSESSCIVCGLLCPEVEEADRRLASSLQESEPLQKKKAKRKSDIRYHLLHPARNHTT